jgi:hypothetical protein
MLTLAAADTCRMAGSAQWDDLLRHAGAHEPLLLPSLSNTGRLILG